MKLGIQINEGPYNHEASVTALNYCKAAIEAGHEIFRIFFYHGLELYQGRVSSWS